MLAIEGILIAVGVVLFIGSFFVTEKLSPKELETLADLSDEEIKKIVENALINAEGQVDEKIDILVEDSMEKVDVALDKITNEKIMAVDEFSNTVIEKINTNHSEVMFLYSMLNDKHSELTDFANDLQEKLSLMKSQKQEIEKIKYSAQTAVKTVQAIGTGALQTKEEKDVIIDESILDIQDDEEIFESIDDETNIDEQFEKELDEANHNTKILERFRAGQTPVQIAKELGIGLGEVKLVIDLFEGDKISEV